MTPNRRFVILSAWTLLAVLWNGVGDATQVIDQQSFPRRSGARLETPEVRKPEQGCQRTCNGEEFGTGTCKGRMEYNCTMRFGRFVGVDMDAQIKLRCDGEFKNSTSRLDDSDQTKVTCKGDLTMNAEVSTVIPLQHSSAQFYSTYQCGKEFSSVTNQDKKHDGSMGLNFYQNAICNGTEHTEFRYSSTKDLRKRLEDTGGSFLKVDMGSCEASAHLLSSIDVLGVLYSYVVIPGCEPEKPSSAGDLFAQEIVPISFSCNGVKQNYSVPCKGLLMGVCEVDHGTVSCKCRGNWTPGEDSQVSCDGELYGEQMRLGLLGSYVRSSVCAGKNTFQPLSTVDQYQRPLSGSLNECHGASVKSTIFEPLSERQLIVTRGTDFQ